MFSCFVFFFLELLVVVAAADGGGDISLFTMRVVSLSV